LECLVARIVSEKLEAADYDYLQSLIDRMESASERGDFISLVDLDIAFHGYLWEKTDQDLLQDLLERIKIQVLYFMYLTLSGDEFEYSKMHQSLLDVLKHRNPEEAAQVMREHIISTAEEAIEKLDME
jgi:DNA-binding GntR family transcriptional regulator